VSTITIFSHLFLIKRTTLLAINPAAPVTRTRGCLLPASPRASENGGGEGKETSVSGDAGWDDDDDEEDEGDDEDAKDDDEKEGEEEEEQEEEEEEEEDDDSDEGKDNGDKGCSGNTG
jgi:hypothetical protein